MPLPASAIQHYTDVIPEPFFEGPEVERVLSYQEIKGLYGLEQKNAVEKMEAVWATVLLTLHMPPFFRFLFSPILYLYFTYINRSHAEQWAARIADPLYASLSLIQTVWNLATSWFFVLFVFMNQPIPSFSIVSIPTQWILQEGEKPKNWPAAVECSLLIHEKEEEWRGKEYPVLLLHFHGGGFVASSPKGHEKDLRLWAIKTRCPILSVDYTLAPEFPFPSAFNQSASVYQYLRSAEAKLKLGFSFNKIVLVGDSAGANMVCAVTLWSLQQNMISPDGNVLLYPSLNRNPTRTSPTLSQYRNDAVIPASFQRIYMNAYISKVWDKNAKDWKFLDQNTKPYFLSPLVAPASLLVHYPKSLFICGSNDPLLCDTIAFHNALCSNSANSSSADILPGFSHAFLSLSTPQTSALVHSRIIQWIGAFEDR